MADIRTRMDALLEGLVSALDPWSGAVLKEDDPPDPLLQVAQRLREDAQTATRDLERMLRD